MSADRHGDSDPTDAALAAIANDMALSVMQRAEDVPAHLQGAVLVMAVAQMLANLGASEPHLFDLTVRTARTIRDAQGSDTHDA